MSRRFLFILGSHRSNGNTELLSREAARQLPADVEQQWISLAEHPLPDFDDLRHGAGDPSRPEEGNHALLLDATLAATDIVIVSPVYWYSLSSHTKRYLDGWTSWMYIPGLGFRAAMAGRTLWGVTTSAGDLPLDRRTAGQRGEQLGRVHEDELRRRPSRHRHRARRCPEGHRGTGAREDVLRPGRATRPLPRRLHTARVRRGICRMTVLRHHHAPTRMCAVTSS